MKTIIKFLIVINLILSLCITVQASPAGNATSYCVGTNYGTGNINTSGDASYAATQYYNLGLYCNYNVYPQKNTLNGSYSNGKKFLASGIVMLSGHGSSTSMQFNYMQNYGDYACGVKATTVNGIPSGSSYYYWGLGNYNLSDVALYIFAGCNTGVGEGNLCAYAVTSGAKAALGWYSAIGATSHSQWLSALMES